MERKLDFKPCVIWVGGDAFVQVVDVKLKGIVADLSLEITVINKLEPKLTKIEYDVMFYDSNETALQEESFNVDGEAISISQNQIGVGSKLNISKSFPSARRAEVKLLKAYFEDGKSIDLIYNTMEKFAINNLQDKEEIRLLQKVAGEDAITLPAKLTLNWRCVCGYFNGDDSKFCNNCFREKEQVLTDYKTMEHIKEIIAKELEGQGEIYQDTESTSEITQDVNEEIKQDDSKENENNEQFDLKAEILEYFSTTSRLTMSFFLLAGILLSSSFFIIIFRFLK